MRITIRYGTGNELTKEFPGTPTVGSVLADASVKAGLGYGDSVEGYLDGIPMSNSITLFNGAILTVHDRACKKAN